MRFPLPAALAALTVLAAPALAYRATLSDALLQDAYAQGTRLATSTDAGYPLRPYTLYAVPDTLKLEARNGDVDAVTIATPFERTRYQVFLHRIGDDPVTAAQAREQAGVPDHQVAFIVFAHGADPGDQAFLKGISPLKFTLGGRTLTPAGSDLSGVSISQYPRTVGEVGVRFIGTVTTRFTVPTGLEAASGTVSFTDATGKVFRIPVDLTQYR